MGLQVLDLTDTKVRDIGPLSGLTGLQTLRLTITKVTDISWPSEWTDGASNTRKTLLRTVQ